MVVPALMAIHGSIDEVDETLVGVADSSFLCRLPIAYEEIYLSHMCSISQCGICSESAILP
jgi:hypothetical protein